MDVRVVSDAGVKQHEVGELAGLLERDDGIITATMSVTLLVWCKRKGWW